jgi:RHS repeat-associated protein
MNRSLEVYFLTLLLALLPLLSQAAQNISLGSYTLVSVVQVKKQLYHYNYQAKATNQGNIDAYQVTAALTPEAIKRFRAIDSSVSFGSVLAGTEVTSTDQFTLSGDNKTPPSNQVLTSKLQWVVSSNTRPVANAGDEQTVQVGETVTLNGSASTDADGDSLTYAWTLLSKPTGSQAVLSSSTAVNPSFLVDKPGEYTLQLIVNDGKMDSGPDSMTISTRNSAPIAQAGPDQTAQVGVAVTLDGSASTDVDGDPLTYRWTLPVKPAGSQASLNNSSAISPVINPDRPGIYEVELIVNDGQVDSAPDRVTINTENSKPVANAGVDQVVQLGQTVTLDGGASYDVDGDPLSFKWSFTTRPSDSTAIFTDPQLQVMQFTPDQAGLYVAQLVVNDSHVDSEPDTAQITVEVLPPPVNHPPQITSTPVTQATVNQHYQYDVDATDLDGDLLSYSLPLSAADMLIDPVTGLIQWTPTSTGTQPVTVKVDDGQGGSDNQSFNITVSPAGSQQVTVPTLTGLTRSAAERAIQQAKLTVGSLSFQHDAAVAGIVLNQSLASSTQVDPGTAVNLTISLGPDNGLPPDPAVVAPNIDATVATTTYDSTKFLYSGDNPVQTGVAAGTIKPERAAVIRGRVLNRDNQPLSGVTITVLDHPEFGQTESRADGIFDMAVNGGGVLVVNYRKPGYLTAQRQLNTPWQDFVLFPNVVLIQRDPQVTIVDLTTPGMKVARGSLQTDSEGSRQATVLIPEGTQAQVFLPDGTPQPVNSLHVHLTEFTVGANGPQAMPAELPPTSAYTYALDLGADEAIAKIGGKDVQFSQPVMLYLENFLGFSVGAQIPVGFYDYNKAAWIPAPDGSVIKIISITNGLADLDTDGDSIVDNGLTLGVTDTERQQLAGLYSIGKTLWRVSTDHFSTADLNALIKSIFARGITDLLSSIGNPIPNPAENIDDPCTQPSSSVIECQNQILNETIGVSGTPYNLNYASDRVSGRKASSAINIPLSGSTVASNLARIDLEITVAGQRLTRSFPPLPNQSFTFTWDGKDAYGRVLHGGYGAVVRIGYVSDGTYSLAQQALLGSIASFGAWPTVETLVRTRQPVTAWRVQNPILVAPIEQKTQNIAGWDLNVHHLYDPSSRILYLGDGSRRSNVTIDETVTTVAGTGTPGNTGDGGKATAAQMGSTLWIDISSENTLYISDLENRVIRRVGTDGTITTLASEIAGPISVDRDQNVYMADVEDSLNATIKRIDPAGNITVIAGNGPATTPGEGDGGPAILAKFISLSDVEVGVDGMIYAADGGRIRRISPDGLISTTRELSELLDFVTDLEIAADGSLLVAGRRSSFHPNCGFDCAFALSPIGMGANLSLFGANPRLVASDSGTGRIYVGSRIGAGYFGASVIGYTPSLLEALKGVSAMFTKSGGSTAEEVPASAAGFVGIPNSIAVGPEGSVYVAEPGRVRKISPYLPNFDGEGISIASEDGSEVYVFDPNGRHLRTLNALTNATLFQFGYDPEGRLRSITDGSNNVTTIERDALGNPTAIVGPFGQRNAVSVDANGYLAGITNPANESYNMTYTPDGLLTQFTNPRENSSTLAYDEVGRLFKDSDPAEGSQTLNRTELANGYEVTRTSGLNRATTYRVEEPIQGQQLRTNILPDGTQSTMTVGSDGTNTSNLPDGTTIASIEGPDPRFGMESPILQSLTTSTGGLTATLLTERTASLADPNNLLTLTSLTDKTTLNGRISTSTYDASTKTTTNTSAAGRTATSVIDNLGRITEAQIAGLLGVNTAYDTRGRLASVSQGSTPDERTVLFGYNDQGYLQTVTDPLQRTVNYEYDLAGRVTRQILPGNREILYGYDKNGNLVSLKPPGRPVHEFKYTKIDLTSEYVPPAVAAGSNSTVYEYNLDKDLKRITRPDGQLIDFIYDTAGRLSTLKLPNGDLGYAYDPTTGKLTQIAAPDGTLDYSYNGALLTQTTWTGAVAGNVAFEYDNDFRVTSLSVNDADPIAFEYDGDSLLTTAGNLTLSRSTENGLLTGSALGNVTDSLSYNGFGEVTGYTAQYSGADMFKTEYSYDKLGRITQKQETIGGITDTYDYGYDLAGRLTEVKKNAVLQSSYGYDANGNRTHQNGQMIATYDDQDRLQTYNGIAYDYTTNGELKTKTAGGQTTTYEHDVLGNLRQVTFPDNTNITYVIDGRNRRIGKKINGTLVQGFLYQDQLKPIAELDGNGNVVSRFVFATRANVPDYMIKGGVTYRIITDHLGSTRLVVDIATNTVAQRIDYDEWGKVTFDSNPGFQPFGFAGGLYDRDTKLVRFGARDYDAETGRWTAKDPILFSGGDANLYGYVVNDPVNLFDLNGLQSTPPRINPFNNGAPVHEGFKPSHTIEDLKNPNAPKSNFCPLEGPQKLDIGTRQGNMLEFENKVTPSPKGNPPKPPKGAAPGRIIVPGGEPETVPSFKGNLYWWFIQFMINVELEQKAY